MTVISTTRRIAFLGALTLGAAGNWLAANADTLPAPAQYAPGTGGLVVQVAGKPVGRLIGYLDGLAPVDLAASASQSGTVLVAQAANLPSAPLLELMSPTGYIFYVSTGSLDLPTPEGELHRQLAVFYDAPNCSGQAYLPVQNPTGRFSAWTLGNGALRPIVRWAARQGLVFQSPDPNDPTPVYMVRRGSAVEETFLRSIKLVQVNATPAAAVCISPPFTPVYDLAVRVEPLDALEAGVSGPLGGEISIR